MIHFGKPHAYYMAFCGTYYQGYTLYDVISCFMIFKGIIHIGHSLAVCLFEFSYLLSFLFIHTYTAAAFLFFMNGIVKLLGVFFLFHYCP